MTDLFDLSGGPAAATNDALSRPGIKPEDVPTSWTAGLGGELYRAPARGYVDTVRFFGHGAAYVGSLFDGDLGEQLHNNVTNNTNDWTDSLTPRANEVGVASRIVGGTIEALTPLAFGGVPVAAGAAGTREYAELRRQGVAPDAAFESGLLQAGSFALGARVPLLGKSFRSRVGLGAASNILLTGATTEAERRILEASGAPQDIVDRYDPLNPESIIASGILGAAFGAIGHYFTPTREFKDAQTTLRNAEHFQEQTAPGHPQTPEAVAAHNAQMEEGVRALYEDRRPEPVKAMRDLPDEVVGEHGSDAPFVRRDADPAEASLADELKAQFGKDAAEVNAESEMAHTQQSMMDLSRELGLPIYFGERYISHGRDGFIEIRPENEFTKELFGGTQAQIVGHEIGHAILDKWRVNGNVDGPEYKSLRAELRAVSKELFPAKWEKHKKHAAKSNELMADGISAWINHPELRTRLAELHDLLGSRLDVLAKMADKHRVEFKEGAAKAKQSGDPVVMAAYETLAGSDIQIPTGEVNADGSLKMLYAKKLLEGGYDDEARNLSKAIKAIGGCPGAEAA